jgi:hypothetical protein
MFRRNRTSMQNAESSMNIHSAGTVATRCALHLQYFLPALHGGRMSGGRMPRSSAGSPVSVAIVEEGSERFLVRTYADGSEERERIVKLPRKKRYPPRPYRHWKLGKRE